MKDEAPRGPAGRRTAPSSLRGFPATLPAVIIGILSDTHDRADAMAAGMRALKAAGAEFFIHCGDVGSERVLDLLAGEPAAFVWGNTDWDRAGLKRYADAIGVACHGAVADLTLDGKRLAVIHGDDPTARWTILESKQYDYLLQGHTHVAADERIGRTRLINPGALFRTSRKSVAALDLATDRLRFIGVDV